MKRTKPNGQSPKADHLDRLQYRLGVKLKRTDAFDFCYYHFYELMEFCILLADTSEIVRLNPETEKAQPISYQDKRNLVKLCRNYDAMSETIGIQKSGKQHAPRVPLRHCLQSLNRVFDQHFDSLLFLTHAEEKEKAGTWTKGSDTV